MSKIKDTRSAAKKSKDARFRNEPVAHVQRPLRSINEMTGSVDTRVDVVTGKETRIWVESSIFQKAKIAAKRGFGAVVQSIARGLA